MVRCLNRGLGEGGRNRYRARRRTSAMDTGLRAAVRRKPEHRQSHYQVPQDPLMVPSRDPHWRIYVYVPLASFARGESW